MTVLLPPAGLHPALTLHPGPVPAAVQAAVGRLRGPDPRLPGRAAHAALYAQAVADGTLVGFCLAEEPNTEPGASWAHHGAAGPELGVLVVDPRWRGRGLGVGLVGAVARAVAASGRTAVAVTAPASPAVAVNRRVGARVAGTFRRGPEELWLWDFAGVR
ncbi:GNAT family N-acetyltransferase [Georgenia thermotolerans]|uniref:GNAT family N-acetyltransferase n=1 Tax=Georgenia thermotolerans TaxID=527326 RepID=UPI0014783157|nr:GNAT family N-acetyltransferase [Georgenia thermotolerans]